MKRPASSAQAYAYDTESDLPPETVSDRHKVQAGCRRTRMVDSHDLTVLSRQAVRPVIGRLPPVVPLPVINGQPPLVLVEYCVPGVDIAYERKYDGSSDDRSVRAAAHVDPRLYWVPMLTPVFAAGAGNVVYAQKASTGYVIAVDDGDEWLTVYGGLAHMFVPPTSRRPSREVVINAGDMLGYLDASVRGPLSPLRFEIWERNRLRDPKAVHAERFLRRWRSIEGSARAPTLSVA